MLKTSRKTAPAASLLLTLVATLALAPVAATQTLTGFDSFAWEFTGDVLGSTGEMDDSSMTVVGPENGCSVPGAWFETGPVAAGTLTVTVAYSSADICHYDWPLFVLDGVRTPIAEAGSGSCYGHPGVTITREIPPGSTFGLGVGSADCFKGAGTAVFTEFSFELHPGQHALWYDEGHALDPRLVQQFSPLAPVTFLGQSVTAPGDLDGDGIDDIVLGGGYDELLGEPQVKARSGATGQVLWVRSGPFSYGLVLASVSDVDGDGHRDVAASDVVSSTVELLSGADGSLIWSWNDPVTTGWGDTLAVLGDLDADGFDELALGRQFFSGGSLPTVILSGADGSLHSTLAVPAGVTSLFGQRTAPAGDVNADGTPDVLVSEADRNVYVFSGADGALLHTLAPPPGFFGTGYGASLHAAGDLNSDGHDDVLVGAPNVPGLSSRGELIPLAGGVAVFSGATGALLDSFFGDKAGAQFGVSLLGDFDADDDGSPDMLVGVEQIKGDAFPDVGGITLRRLVDGAQLFEYIDSEPTDDFSTLSALHAPGGVPSTLAIVERPDQQPYAISLWEQLTHPGAPVLNPGGSPLPGENFTLKLRRAPPFATVGFVLGSSTLHAAFKRGVLVPAPDKILFVNANGLGVFATGGVWPANIGPTSPIWVQAWVLDAAGPAGATATRAVRSVY